MRPIRTLRLRREAFTDLTTGELAGVAGAEVAPKTLPPEECLSLGGCTYTRQIRCRLETVTCTAC